MLKQTERLMYKSEAYDNEMYWERVNRSLGWLGSTEEEQVQRQKTKRCCYWNCRNWWYWRSACCTTC